jgi:hypothetical protein
LNFALTYDLLIANTIFRKRESHLVTFRSGQHSSQVDFILARREDKCVCFDCKVLPGECVVPQHKLVVADFRFRVRVHRDKRAKIKDRWREYFDKLFNEENEGPALGLDDSFDDTNRCFVRRI